MWFWKLDNHTYNENKEIKNKENKKTDHLENAIKELWKLVWQEELDKLTKDLQKIDKVKHKEISEAIKPHKIGLTFYHKEVTLSTELPPKLDYSNPEDLKKTSQIALLKTAREQKFKEA